MTTAFHIIDASRDVPLYVFGDHASRYIPAAYDNLGLTGEDLTRHIAWDIGTDVIVRHLCTHFGAAGQIAGASRLLIDLNRDIAMPSSIPVESDGTPVPGNQNLTDAERQARINMYHTPYHKALAARLNAYDDPLVISIHSFTPKPNLGGERTLDFGLLVKHDEVTAQTLLDMFRQRAGQYNIAVNEPYSAHVLNYTIDTAVAAKGYRHLAIEVNQRLIDTDETALDIARLLATCLEPIVFQAPETI